MEQIPVFGDNVTGKVEGKKNVKN